PLSRPVESGIRSTRPRREKEKNRSGHSPGPQISRPSPLAGRCPAFTIPAVEPRRSSSMKSLAAAIALAVVAPAFAADSAHPFDVHDLVMMDRVSDPALSPDGKLVAFQVRETDYDANKGSNGVWIVPAGGGK